MAARARPVRDCLCARHALHRGLLPFWRRVGAAGPAARATWRVGLRRAARRFDNRRNVAADRRSRENPSAITPLLSVYLLSALVAHFLERRSLSGVAHHEAERRSKVALCSSG